METLTVNYQLPSYTVQINGNFNSKLSASMFLLKKDDPVSKRKPLVKKNLLKKLDYLLRGSHNSWTNSQSSFTAYKAQLAINPYFYMNYRKESMKQKYADCV